MRVPEYIIFRGDIDRAEVIRRMRAGGMTLAACGDALGISRPRVAQIERKYRMYRTGQVYAPVRRLRQAEIAFGTITLQQAGVVFNILVAARKEISP